MTTESAEIQRWKKAGALFHELVELDETARNERLREIADSDAKLASDINELLAGDAAADEKLPTPGFGLRTSAVDTGDDPLGIQGETIGRFRVLSRLGSGGMGVVYNADDTQLGRKVALKFPSLRKDLNDSARIRIIAEARAAAALDHPNLCPIYEIGESSVGPFFAMPLYGGETLKSRLAREPSLSLRESLLIIAQIAAGIDCAHRAGLMHGDVKPANVMLLTDGTAKILDFGLARATSSETSNPQHAFGTVHYMAPEQIRGDSVDHRADLWALGVLVYEMLGGEKPFAASNALATLHDILHHQPKPLAELRPDLPAEIDSLVAHLLEKDPGKRTQSAQEVIDVIARVRQRERDTQRSSGRAFRKRLKIAGAFVALVLAFGLIAWLRPKATLIGRGIIAPHDTVVLADMTVRGPDSLLSEPLTVAVRRDFTDANAISLLPAPVTRSALKRMTRHEDDVLTPALAREVARRQGAKAVIAGEVTPLSRGYLITLRMIGAETGEELTSTSATAVDPEKDLLPVLASAGASLRSRIGESLSNVPFIAPPPRQVTTNSLAALRVMYGPHDRSAVTRIMTVRQAIALDSSFAYAWMVLGNFLTGLGRVSALDASLSKAYALRDRLTLMERAQVTSFYLEDVQTDRRRALMSLQTALAEDSTIAWPVAANAVRILMATRQFEQADALARKMQHWYGDGAGANVAKQYHIRALTALGRYAEAESVNGGVVPQLDREERLFAARLHGKLAEAHEMRSAIDSEKVAIAAAANVRIVPEASRILDLAREDLWLRGRGSAAIAHVDTLLGLLIPARQIQDRIDADAAAAILAAAGNPSRAQSVVDAAEKGADATTRRAMLVERNTAMGEIALAQNRFADAMKLFRESDLAADGLPANSCSVCVVPLLARVADRAGWADSSRTYWERYVNEPAIERAGTDQWYLAYAYRRLATLYSETGNSDRAASYRRKLESLLKDADPELRARN